MYGPSQILIYYIIPEFTYPEASLQELLAHPFRYPLVNSSLQGHIGLLHYIQD